MPDGTYSAQCVGYDQSFVMGKSRKLFLHFKIVDWGKHHHKRLFMAFNMPYDKKIRPGSKYYKTWVKVNGWNRPSRHAIMSPKLFKNKIYKIKTRTCLPKEADGKKDMPDTFKYSVVDTIEGVEAG